ncbi:DUF1526 domain-containing protein [Pseudonocardia sp. Ae406_Ps2]|uniref:hypothetical protein n=1 Tax=unclassified Pseudonocardia TaxID=2619320 RepID=UPI00094B16B9|nr:MULTISPECIES: hypothetical protein [unclassified Pseudonocardia]OLL99514.1 DUF1526 domain-containing protein [Pseudonocardia sp. Ae331_Ps2]OLM02745.1 DUF1526 domain-containing protein [Pseudonocardia sp. Ae406_Ps2]OLM24323.1 DUF1526 domain-containing protein [Pseudonocardia sp. Ae706_Ps2]
MSDWIDDWLSMPRFDVYLADAAGDRDLALARYDWNARAAAAFHHDLGHLEVGLRNAYDRALRAAAPDGPHWVFAPDRHFSPLLERTRRGKVYDSNETSRKVIDAAVRSARRATGTSRPDPGKVIAEIGFGFWRYLSARRLSERLWVPYLHHAFRPGTGRPAVDGPVGRLHDLRNRVAHNEPLIRRNLDARYADILTVAGLLSAELREHIAGQSPVPGALADRP